MFTVLCTAPIHETVLAMVGMLKTDIVMAPGATIVLVADSKVEITNAAPLDAGATSVNVNVDPLFDVAKVGVETTPAVLTDTKKSVDNALVAALLESRIERVQSTEPPMRTSVDTPTDVTLAQLMVEKVADGDPTVTMLAVPMTPPPPASETETVYADTWVAGAVKVKAKRDPTGRPPATDVSVYAWMLGAPEVTVGVPRSASSPVVAPLPSAKRTMHVTVARVRVVVGAHANVDAVVGVPTMRIVYGVVVNKAPAANDGLTLKLVPTAPVTVAAKVMLLPDTPPCTARHGATHAPPTNVGVPKSARNPVVSAAASLTVMVHAT
jgi:hypothetical protein